MNSNYDYLLHITFFHVFSFAHHCFHEQHFFTHNKLNLLSHTHSPPFPKFFSSSQKHKTKISKTKGFPWPFLKFVFLVQWKFMEILPFNQWPLHLSWTNGNQGWFDLPMEFRTKILVFNETLKGFHPLIKIWW